MRSLEIVALVFFSILSFTSSESCQKEQTSCSCERKSSFYGRGELSRSLQKFKLDFFGQSETSLTEFSCTLCTLEYSSSELHTNTDEMLAMHATEMSIFRVRAFSFIYYVALHSFRLLFI